MTAYSSHEFTIQKTDPQNSIFDFSQISGIDTNAGLRVTQGNADLYHKVLLKFYKMYHNFEEQFYQAQNNYDPNAAKRLTHNLKGSAANIGAKEIYTAAHNLEIACNKNLNIEIALNEVIKVLYPLINSLKCFEESASIQDQNNTLSYNFDKNLLNTLISKLHKLVMNDNIQAITIAKEIDLLLTHTDSAQSFRQILITIENYDFDLSLDLLKRFSHEQNIPWTEID